MQHGDELAQSAMQERERDQSGAHARHGHHDRVEDFHGRGHFAGFLFVVGLTESAVIGGWRPVGHENEHRMFVFVRRYRVQHVERRQHAVCDGHDEQRERIRVVQRRQHANRTGRPVSWRHLQRHHAEYPRNHVDSTERLIHVRRERGGHDKSFLAMN